VQLRSFSKKYENVDGNRNSERIAEAVEAAEIFIHNLKIIYCPIGKKFIFQ
jgi:hypothetical protein